MSSILVNFAVCLFLCQFQTDQEFIVKNIISQDGNSFSIDGMNNIYFINQNQLIKYEATTNKKTDFSLPSTPLIQSIDVSDPFQILVFDQANNRIVFLNNKLSEHLSPILFDDLDIFNPVAICNSAHGGFWVFDGDDMKIKHFDKNLSLVNESNALDDHYNQCLSNQILLKERNGIVYLYFKSTGILMFDRYGGYIKTLPVTNFDEFQLYNDKIGYYISPNYYFYDLNSYQVEMISVPKHDNLIDCIFHQRNLYIYSGKELITYQLND